MQDGRGKTSKTLHWLVVNNDLKHCVRCKYGPNYVAEAMKPFVWGPCQTKHEFQCLARDGYQPYLGLIKHTQAKSMGVKALELWHTKFVITTAHYSTPVSSACSSKRRFIGLSVYEMRVKKHCTKRRDVVQNFAQFPSQISTSSWPFVAFLAVIS
jgi:hypothetical protein